MTYDELVTNIRNYTEVGSNVFTEPVINTFITMAENQILREIDLDVFKVEVAGKKVTRVAGPGRRRSSLRTVGSMSWP